MLWRTAFYCFEKLTFLDWNIFSILRMNADNKMKKLISRKKSVNLLKAWQEYIIMKGLFSNFTSHRRFWLSIEPPLIILKLVLPGNNDRNLIFGLMLGVGAKLGGKKGLKIEFDPYELLLSSDGNKKELQ